MIIITTAAFHLSCCSKIARNCSLFEEISFEKCWKTVKLERCFAHPPKLNCCSSPTLFALLFGTIYFETAQTEKQSEDFCDRLQTTPNHWSSRWRLWPFGAALQGALAAQSSGSCTERQGLTLAFCCACLCRLNLKEVYNFPQKNFSEKTMKK